MTPTERVLIRLLEWFDTGSSQPLIGDLLEESRSGRSRWWLFRQTCAAIARSFASAIASNKLLSLRGIGVGMVVVMPLTALTRRFPLPHWADGTWTLWGLSCLAFAIAGMAIAHTFPRRPAAMVTVFTLYAVIAKLSLLGFNAQRFIGGSQPLRDLAIASAIVLAPLCAIVGAMLLPALAERRT